MFLKKPASKSIELDTVLLAKAAAPPSFPLLL
jgi:hypothetical protein